MRVFALSMRGHFEAFLHVNFRSARTVFIFHAFIGETIEKSNCSNFGAMHVYAPKPWPFCGLFNERVQRLDVMEMRPDVNLNSSSAQAILDGDSALSDVVSENGFVMQRFNCVFACMLFIITNWRAFSSSAGFMVISRLGNLPQLAKYISAVCTEFMMMIIIVRENKHYI